MTIASEITRINNNIASSYTACSNKGATLPATQNSANLPNCINSIEVSRYGAKFGTFFGNVDGSGKMSMPSYSTNLSFDGVTDLGQYALRRTFSNNPAIITATFPDLTTISGNYGLNNTFNNCTNLTSISLPNLTTISAQNEFYGMCANPSARTVDLSSLTNAGSRSFYQAFNSNTNLTSVDFSSLTVVTGHLSFYQAFTGCTGLTSMSFPSLVTIGDATATGTNCQHFSSAFSGCTGLTTLTFPELTAIYCNGANNANNGSFTNNETITKMYFPKLSEISYAPAYTGSSTTVTSACKYIFSGCTALTELHFGAANENAIKATAGWSTLWGRGAGNATVYFDL